MLTAHLKLLRVKELPAKGDYPSSLLVTLYDADSADTLTLVADRETASDLLDVAEFSDVELRLRWYRIQLGAGKGNGYRLRIQSVEDPS